MDIQVSTRGRTAIMAAFVGLMLLMPIIQVLADSQEGFDTYTAGNYAGSPSGLPAQWTWASAQSQSGDCWIPTNLAPTGIEPLPNYQQPDFQAQTSPNIFEWNFNSNCRTYTSVNGTLSTKVVATSSNIQVNWYEALLNVSVKTDPVTIGTTSNTNLFGRKVWVGEGLYWVFYANGAHVVYQTCATVYGSSCATTAADWSAPANVASFSGTGAYFNTWYDPSSNTFCYILAESPPDSTYLNIDCGAFTTSGTITWSYNIVVWSLTYLGAYTGIGPSIYTSGPNNVWVSFPYYSGDGYGDYNVQVAHCSTTCSNINNYAGSTFLASPIATGTLLVVEDPSHLVLAYGPWNTGGTLTFKYTSNMGSTWTTQTSQCEYDVRGTSGVDVGYPGSPTTTFAFASPIETSTTGCVAGKIGSIVIVGSTGIAEFAIATGGGGGGAYDGVSISTDGTTYNCWVTYQLSATTIDYVNDDCSGYADTPTTYTSSESGMTTTTLIATPYVSSGPIFVLNWEAGSNVRFGGTMTTTSVSQSLKCSATYGTPTLTLSGGSVSPTTLNCDNSYHPFTVNIGATITATEPSDGTNTRYRFNSHGVASTTWTVPACGASPCTPQSTTNYYQLENTWRASPVSPVTWDGIFVIQVIGTYIGTSMYLGCSLTTSNGGGAVTCPTANSWFDYDLPVTFTSPISDGAYTWTASPATFTPTTGGNTEVAQYTRTSSVTTVTLPLECTSTHGAPVLTLTASSGTIVPSTLTCSTSPSGPTSFTVNANAVVTATEPSDATYTRYRFDVSGLPSTTWQVPACSSGTCPTASTTNYYQLENTYTATPNTPTTWDGVFTISVTGYIVGLPTVGCTLTTVNHGSAVTCSAVNSWFDYYRPTNFTNPISDTPYQWSAPIWSFSQITGHNTNNAQYTRTGVVTQPIKCTPNTFAFGTPIVNLTVPIGDIIMLSGGSNATYTALLTCDGNSHSYLVTGDVTITATEPANTSSFTRYMFSNDAHPPTASSTATWFVCPSGTCSSWTFTNYYQLYNEYEAVPSSPANWDGAFPISVVGTYLGAGSIAANSNSGTCPMTTANYGGMVFCWAWFDYNLAVTVKSPLPDGISYSWKVSVPGDNIFAQITGDNTNVVAYIRVTAIIVYQPFDCTSTHGTAIVNLSVPYGNTIILTGGMGIANDSALLTCDGSSHSYTVSGGVVITMTEPSDSTYTRYRFYNASTFLATTILSVTACATGTCTTETNTNYYQVGNNYIITLSSGTWDAAYDVSVRGYSVGISSQILCTITTSIGGTLAYCPAGLVWSDYGTLVSLPASFSDATAGTWVAQGMYSFTPTSGNNTYTITYLFSNTIVQPIKAILTGVGGTNQTISITGCNPVPSTFFGNDTAVDIQMDAGCSGGFLLTTTSNYLFLEGGNWISSYAAAPSCSTGVCSTLTVSYKYTSTPVVKKNDLILGSVVFEVLINGEVRFTNDSSTMPVCTNTQCNWIEVIGVSSFTVVPGSINTVSFEVLFRAPPGASSDLQYSFSFAVDTISFINADPYIPNSNFFLRDYSTSQLFNVSAYFDSKLMLNYTSLGSAVPNSNCSGFSLGYGIPAPQVFRIGNQCVVSYLSAPDIIVPNFQYASLATAMVGGPDAYSRSVIPCENPTNRNEIVQNVTGCDTQTIYLDNPSSIAHYLIQINDLSTVYNGAGVRLFIYEGTTLITSGYTDAGSTFPTALVPGTYKVILLNSKGDEYTTSLNAGAVSAGTVGILTIGIANVPFTVSTNIGALSIGAGWDCDGVQIIAAYSDGYKITTGVTFTLEIYNWPGISGTTINATDTTLITSTMTGVTTNSLVGLYLEYMNGPAIGQSQLIISNTETTITTNAFGGTNSGYTLGSPNPDGGDSFITTGRNGLSMAGNETVSMLPGEPMTEVTFNANYSYASQYLLQANVSRTDGNYAVLGPISIGSLPEGCNHKPSGFPYTPTFPNTLLGLNDVLPNPAAWLNLLALFIVLMTAALFGSRPASLGAIIVVAEAIVFAWAGWLPLITFYGTLFMLAAIMLFLTEKARRRSY